jgi:hypothetical protein
MAKWLAPAAAVGGLAFGLILGLGLGSRGTLPEADQEPLIPPGAVILDGPDCGAQWSSGKRIPVFFAGIQAPRDTTTFRVTGRHWRIDWATGGNPRGEGQITVRNAEGKTVHSFDANGKDFVYENGPGVFSLTLFPSGFDGWMVAQVRSWGDGPGEIQLLGEPSISYKMPSR